MPFDTFAMAAVADEICAATLGGQIQRIIQPSSPSISLGVYAGGSLRWLVLSADARDARVHLASERLAKGFPTPGPFVMLLRKYLEGARVALVRQEPYERVLRLECGVGERAVTLLAEIMGKHSNLILIDTDGRILGALKIVPPRQSSVRPILPGGTYSPPPSRGRDPELYGDGPRPDPATEPAQVAALLHAVPSGTPVQTALLGLLPGASPFLARQIALRAGTSGDAQIADHAAALKDAAASMYALYHSRLWEPWTFAGKAGRLDCAPYPPLGVTDPEPAGSMSLAVERCFGSGENRDALASVRANVAKTVERALGASRRRASSLAAGLEATEEAEVAMQTGQMILAYQYLVVPGATELRIPDLDMVIALDPALSPSENADRAFRRYRKLRDARARIPALLAGAETEAARLEDILAFVRLAGSESELRALERQVSGRDDARASSRARQAKRSGPVRYRLDGYTALVGRNAAENEEVTFRLARRDDLWMHARQRTGAHVALQGDANPPDGMLEAAARLAAYFSEGRTDTAVDVDCTRIRDVRKIAGGPPGRVTYRNERTLRVTPGLGEWEQLSR